MKQTGVTRTVTESEMAALIKRQTVSASNVSVGNKTGIGISGAASLTPAQILAQAGLQAQQSGQVAALVKAVPAQTHIPVTGLTIPQVNNAVCCIIRFYLDSLLIFYHYILPLCHSRQSIINSLKKNRRTSFPE